LFLISLPIALNEKDYKVIYENIHTIVCSHPLS
jgi:hypothetical protein